MRFRKDWIVDVAVSMTYPLLLALDAADIVGVSVGKLTVNVDVLSGTVVVGKGKGFVVDVLTVADEEGELLLDDVLVIVTIEIEGVEEDVSEVKVDEGVDDGLVERGVVLGRVGVDVDVDLITQGYDDR